VPDDPKHGALFEHWSCRPETVFSTATLRAWLVAPPAGLLRLKGVLRTGEEGREPIWSELQFAGRHGSLRPVRATSVEAALVAIGLKGQLPAAALAGVFNPGR
jgi:hypothetical protein